MTTRSLGLASLCLFVLAGACQEVEETPGGAEVTGEAQAALVAPGAALFVVGSTNLSAADSTLRSRLQGLGFSVSIVTGPASRASDASGKSLVVISESVTSADVGNKFRTVSVPILCLESAVFDDMGMTGTVNGTDYGEVPAQTDLRLVATSHALATGATVTVTSSAQAFAFGRPAAGAARIATIAGNSSQAAIFGYELGQAMVGLTAPARRVGWFAGKTTPSNLNAHGWRLFDAAVGWAVSQPVCSPGQLRSCAEAGMLGACSKGMQTCSSSGTWGTCSIVRAPADGCSPGDDANCNGIVNEGCSCNDGASEPCGIDVGNCVSGTQFCSGGRWSACLGSVQPAAADNCNPGDDANCNGIANEGCACTDGAARSCGTDIGNCVSGTQTCSAGRWSACLGSVQPAAADNCNPGDDANCNGIANEGCP